MKAILVVDMPNNCYDCQYCRFDARRYIFRGCVLTDTDVQDGTIDICKEVHSCCPLKPMPEKLYVEAYQIEDLMPSEFDMDKWTLKIKLDADKIFAFGWNKCLEELGETE